MGTILAAIGMGIVVLLAGDIPFNVLRAWNLQAGTAVPWAILPAALYSAFRGYMHGPIERRYGRALAIVRFKEVGAAS